MVKKGLCHEFSTLLRRNKTFINYIFLGVGLSLLVLNLSAFMGYVFDMNYSKVGFNVSVFSAMLIVVVTVYNVTVNK